MRPPPLLRKGSGKVAIGRLKMARVRYEALA